MIQIGPEQCPLKTNHKFQISSAKAFKVLQIIESNSYIIKLPLNFDINFIFDMKKPVIHKLQNIFDALLDTPLSLSLSHKKTYVLMLL